MMARLIQQGKSSHRSFLSISIALLACLQWIALRSLGTTPPHPWTALLPGLCILGAAFLMTWAAEAAEMDMPQSLSIGLVALLAVLPEYAVDMYFAWQAGKNPSYAAFATANMTGANRLLIGAGWPAVLLACWYKHGTREIRLTRRNAIEIVTLLAATVYSFILPLKATLSLIDSVVLLSLFGIYAWLSSRAGIEEPELEGTALLIAGLPTTRRRLVVGALFLLAGASIALSAQPFAEGLLESGRRWGIEEFILVQWLAPLASEAPEFIVAMIFSAKGKPQVGLRALVSSKVNQWTVLVGMIPVAYSLSAGSPRPLPLDARQVEEIFLTSAQSIFGMVLLMNLVFTSREALALFGLFALQLAFPQSQVRYAFSALYLVLALALIVAQGHRRASLRDLIAEIFGR